MIENFYNEKRFKDLEWAAMHWEVPDQLMAAIEARMTPQEREADALQAHLDFVETMQRRLVSMPCCGVLQ